MKPLRIAFLHISKTGGMAIKHMVRRHRKAFKRRIVLHRHEVTFADVVRADAQTRVLFVVRDPVERFVSGFNSRMRKAAPRKFREWDEGERVAFGRFNSANALAEALSASDPELRDAAAAAMNAVWHARHALTYWLDSVEFLERHRSRIWYIGEQAHLDEDVAWIRARLDLPETIGLPADESAAHRTPTGYGVALSPAGRRNIEAWYAADFPVYEWCRAERRRTIAET